MPTVENEARAAPKAPAAPAPLLDVTDLHTYYGDSHVLQGCTLTVGPECVAVLGRNGMGKTTLLRSLMGLTPPRRGSVHWNGRAMTGRSPYAIATAGVGYVPQGRRLFPSLSVEEHLTLMARTRHSRDPWTPARVFALFPELAERRKLGASLLSGGEQQMLAIGRALVTNPALILLDEPSEGLAPVAVDRVIDTCRALRAAGIAVLLVEQNLRVAEALADRVYVLVGGRTVYDAPAADFLADQALRLRYLGV